MSQSGEASGSDQTTPEIKSFARRDELLALEATMAKLWEEEGIFEQDAPEEGEASSDREKFLITFPYPYMNGCLHLGHGFSFSKADFAAGFQTKRGRHVLFPQAFHCTGMPIAACAKKLQHELTTFGTPPQFPVEEEEATEEEATPAPSGGGGDAAARKFTSGKSKLTSKAKSKYQWEILQDLQVPEEEIPQFVNPIKWMEYFPPRGVDDLKLFGAHVDWRRSFITTDASPFYDSFIRWQFEHLKSRDKIRFGKRYTIYSPTDGQPCQDHDRSSGEGVGPQEYTVIKMKILEYAFPSFSARHLCALGEDVFLAAATLRPETMYGQTNCWVLPGATYGAYRMIDNSILVMSEHAARNFAFQEQTQSFGEAVSLCEVKGEDLLGALVTAPLSSLPAVRVLPMPSISMTKGTGIVTSVPSDSADDYMTLLDLKVKDAMRSNLKVEAEWVSVEVIPIISIPGYSEIPAKDVCEKLKIKSHKDANLLTMAKEELYQAGFYKGVMAVGDFVGKTVFEAKDLVRQQLLDSGLALKYAEPEKEVMSRSGDRCVVALCDQWYLTYGDPSWRNEVKECVDRMTLYSEAIRTQMNLAVDWLNEWACSRTFGLGTHLPWDPQYVVDSLSDSTIYMAFYTIAHLLHGKGSLDGSVLGPYGITPDQMTSEVWDHIFLNKPCPAACTIPAEALAKMRREFEYWYGVDLRVSGRDLIKNHLTMFIYNHCALFDKEKWPKSIFTNGFVVVDRQKMAKSTGNFITIRGGIEEYSASALRIALADCGDDMEDANFVRRLVNKTILDLYKELKWIEEVVAKRDSNEMRTGDLTFADRSFLNELSLTIEQATAAYEGMLFRQALKHSWFELTNKRDQYRKMCNAERDASNTHVAVSVRYVEVLVSLLAPIAPHFCDHVWRHLLKKEGSALTAPWPVPEPQDLAITLSTRYLVKALEGARAWKERLRKKNPQAQYNVAALYVNNQYEEWQMLVLQTLQEIYAEMHEIPKDISKRLGSIPQLKPNFKKVMPFVKMIQQLVESQGPSALEIHALYDEMDVLEQNRDFVCRDLEVPEVRFFLVTPGEPLSQEVDPAQRSPHASPNQPSCHFWSV